MITDIFARRYEKAPLAKGLFQEDRRFMAQAAAMIMDPLWLGQRSDKPSDFTERCLKTVHDQLALELGVEFLADRYWFHRYKWQGNDQTTTYTNTYATICKTYLTTIAEDPADADDWIKERLSLIELAFRLRWQQLQAAELALPAQIAKAKAEDAQRAARTLRVPGDRSEGMKAVVAKNNANFAALAAELNDRMRLALLPLTFHNGIIQLAADEVADAQVPQPFWKLVGDPLWANVDQQMKEAVDRRDRADRTAAFHAVCALESVIKIISDQKGWTRGSEKGASQYVDNLVSETNGRFIEVWEAEMLRDMFSDVRNPFAHGPGTSPMPQLSAEQTDWAIDTAMSWTKNLIRRL